MDDMASDDNGIIRRSGRFSRLCVQFDIPVIFVLCKLQTGRQIEPLGYSLGIIIKKAASEHAQRKVGGNTVDNWSAVSSLNFPIFIRDLNKVQYCVLVEVLADSSFVIDAPKHV